MKFDVVLHCTDSIRTWTHPNRELQLARVTAIMSHDPDVWVESDGFTTWMQPDGKSPCTVTLCTPNEFPSAKSGIEEKAPS